MDEELHREFLLQAMRAAMLRCKVMHADLETVSVALKGEMIGADTAVAWIRDAGLLGMVGALPHAIGRLASTMETENAQDPA